MTALHITDLDIKITELNSGKYLIDDSEIVDVTTYKDNKVQYRSNIKRIYETTITTKYVYGESEMSVSEYDDKKYLLNSKKDDSLEDEFEYRKFIQRWIPIKKVIEETSEPLSISITEVVNDTKNEFIRPMFKNKIDIKDTLYTLNRCSAQLDSFHTIMKELGMTYKSDISYNQTKDSKIYGGNISNNLRYAVGFNTFIFGDDIVVNNIYNGTLDQCWNIYNNDKQKVIEIVTEKYNRYFNAFDSSKINSDTIIKDIDSAINGMKEISYNKKSYNEYLSVLGKLRNIKSEFLKGFEN